MVTRKLANHTAASGLGEALAPKSPTGLRIPPYRATFWTELADLVRGPSWTGLGLELAILLVILRLWAMSPLCRGSS